MLPLVIVPTAFLLCYALLLFLPASINSPGQLKRATTIKEATNASGVAVSSANAPWIICPRPSICSEGGIQIALLAVARLSAYTLYSSLAASILSKCYCSINCLRSTVLGLYVPFRCVHDLHRVAGLAFLFASVLHAAAHLARWALRDATRQTQLRNGDSTGYHLTTATGMSGTVAVVLLLVSVIPMWRRKLFSQTSFERRHLLHLIAVPMVISLCWHHPNLTVVFGFIGGLWSLDRTYLTLFKTTRVEDVKFTRLADGSVRMAWRNPPGMRARPGQYVRIMVPTINRELHPFSMFDYLPNLDLQAVSHHACRRSVASFSASEAQVADLLRGTAVAARKPMNANDPGPLTVVDITPPMDAVTRTADEEAQVLSPPPLPVEVVTGGSLSTASATADQPSYSQVLIGPFGDWTRALSEHVLRCSEDSGSWAGLLSPTPPVPLRAFSIACPVMPPHLSLSLSTHPSFLASPHCRSGEAWIQGPFTSPFNSSLGYGRLLLVVTGIGLSAALPIVQQLMCSEREVYLVWITRSKEQILFMLPLLVKCTSTIIFYDGTDNMDDVQSGLNKAHRHVRVYVGRPQLERTIDWIVMSKYTQLVSKLQPQVREAHEQETFIRRVRKVSKEIMGRSNKVTPLEVADELRLPADVTSFYSCDAKLLLENLPGRDRTSWALLYCGNVPPVKQAVRASSKKWGFLYSEESFAW